MKKSVVAAHTHKRYSFACRSSSFTVIEIVIVVFLISILTAAASIYIPQLIIKAQTQKAAEDLRAIADAALRYHTDTGEWPQWPRTVSNANMLGAGFIDNRRFSYWGGTLSPHPRWQGPYLESWPYHPWTKDRTDQTSYQWDRRMSIVTPGECHYMIEVSLAYITNTARRLYITRLLDKIIDQGDGPCAGYFRGDRWQCPNWSSWPYYLIAPRQPSDTVGGACTT